MKRRILSFLTILALLTPILPFNYSVVNAADGLTFNKLREVDRGSFNEFGYKITKTYTKLDEIYKTDFVIDSQVTNELLSLVEEAYKYLPDDLNNEAKYRDAKVSLKLGLKYPNNDTYFEKIRKSLENFIEKASIQSLKGSIVSTPSEGNAPLISTLRAEVEDPSGTAISRSSYVWWMNINGKRTVIGTKPSISHTFTEEGVFTVFLDVKSSHKNSNGYRDVLPYSGSVKVNVKEKIASVILRISGKSLDYDNEIKFSPDTAGYGLIFDATSSVAASGTKFTQTTWDFGNGVKKTYTGGPRIERIIYSREGNYDAVLKLKTNNGKTIEKEFKILVHNPIASIKASSTEGYMGDKFTFRAVSFGDPKYLTYSWEIIDTKKDIKVANKTGNVFIYSFKDKGEYSISLKIKDGSGKVDVDNETIHINSRPPIANFSTKIPFKNKPNKVFFDATSSYDPDFDDDGNLKYSWTIDGQKVNLDESNEDGSNGFYTFSTIGDHSIVLEVEDLDELTSTLRGSVKINSLLDVDFSIYPRVVQREGTVRFIGESKEAEFYTWDFGDGESKSGKSSKITHSYSKSGIFPVTLTVRGKNRTNNSFIKNVYVGDSKNPVSVIDITKQGAFDFAKEENACSGKTAYIVSRKDNIIFSGKESIDTNGKNTGLSYSWLVGQGKYKTGQSINERFDELGCYRVKLTVKSERDKSTNFSEMWVKVKNMNPTIYGLKISSVNLNTDPVIVNVSALGTKDPDGVIQSYLWYYTTDIDNEAQDFRITKIPSTTFVIPKIQGTYYFGVMLKDNNGAKVNSEDLVNKIGNNFIELQGDNSNTPLIDFTSSDSSVAIGEEVSFRAVAKNIRGDSIEKSAKFSWDFDGDGFYDKETDKGNITYKYKKSGTFYPKVKVRNKGFSNTRTLTMSVSNKLVSDFKYISVGNKFIFVDTSKGTIDNNSWDLGDGTKQEDKEKIIHKYEDKKISHFVELKVSEGSKVKKSTKEVEKDFRNLIKTRRKGLNVFSFPALSSSGTITLEEEDDVYMYLGESKGDFDFYGIDYDIDKDSDINGGADDDIDNKNNSSYKNGSPDKIILNDNREQTIRLFLLDKDGKTIDSKDIQIIKEYIEEEKEITVGEFKGVTDSEKAKIEKLKISLSKLPQKDRMKAMQFVQKLQENWGDETEKVRTIISFEEFIKSTGYENYSNINDLLESLISEDNSDEKAVSFEVLKALIPNDIQCSVESGTCKESLIKKLETIKNSSNIEENKKIGADFGVIGKDKTMTVKQKTDFKGILQILIYGGVNNISKEDKEEQKKEDNKNSGTVGNEEVSGGGDSDLGGFLKNIGWWIAGIVGVIILIMFAFWMVDFLKNRKSGESFEDFVDNKTNEDDVLGDFSDPLDENTVVKEEKSNKEEVIFSKPKEEKIETKIQVSNTEDNKKDTSIKEEKSTEEIPDWLSGNVEEQKEDNKKQEEDFGFSLDVPEEEKNEDVSEVKTEEISENKRPVSNIDNNKKEISLKEETSEEIPDWLSGSLEDSKDEESEIKTEKVEEKREETNIKESRKKLEEKSQEDKNQDENLDFDIEKETSIEEDEDNTPDWLKDSLTDKLPEKKDYDEEVDKIKEEEIVKNKRPVSNTENNKKETGLREEEPVVIEDKKEEELKLDTEEDIPDWLKGSIEETSEKKEENKRPVSNNTENNKKDTGIIEKEPLIKEEEKVHMGDSVKLDKEDIPDWLKESVDDDKKEKSSSKEKSLSKEKVKTKEKRKNTTKTKTKEETKKTESNKKDDELWDDGMDVPDWLKTD